MKTTALALTRPQRARERWETGAVGGAGVGGEEPVSVGFCVDIGRVCHKSGRRIERAGGGRVGWGREGGWVVGKAGKNTRRPVGDGHECGYDEDKWRSGGARLRSPVKRECELDAVRLRQVVKDFGPVRALDGLSVAIAQGTIYGILGPNGVGKTTMIRVIAGLLEADEGEVRLLDRAPGSAEALANMGYMPQAAALYDELTVRENVAFFAACYGREEARAAEEAVEFVGLQERAGSQVRTLSGGMKQRVSLACAIAHEPKILLLDEPTVGVDPLLRAQLWERFRKMAAAGTTILMSSHIMDEAERCDTLGLILRGRMLAEGSAGEIRERTGTADLEEAFLSLAGRGNEAA